MRVDHDFSERDHVYGFTTHRRQTRANTLVQAPYSGLGLSQYGRRNDTLSFSYTRTFTNNIINEARGGLTTSRTEFTATRLWMDFFRALDLTSLTPMHTVRSWPQ